MKNLNLRDIRKVMDQLRKEFESQLSGPHVSWDKKGMMFQLEKAIANTLAEVIETNSASEA